MSDFDFNYTLFTSEENGTPLPYELQIATTFDTNQYVPGGFTIITSPEHDEGTLHIQLELTPGNDEIVIHDLSLGILPNYTPKWVIDIEYIDSSGNPIGRKKKNTEQAEIEAKPKPFK